MTYIVKHFYDTNMLYLGNIMFCNYSDNHNVYFNMSEDEYNDMLNKRFPKRKHCITNTVKKMI